jgi:hypothetical protein
MKLPRFCGVERVVCSDARDFRGDFSERFRDGGVAMCSALSSPGARELFWSK